MKIFLSQKCTLKVSTNPFFGFVSELLIDFQKKLTLFKKDVEISGIASVF